MTSHLPGPSLQPQTATLPRGGDSYPTSPIATAASAGTAAAAAAVAAAAAATNVTFQLGTPPLNPAPSTGFSLHPAPRSYSQDGLLLSQQQAHPMQHQNQPVANPKTQHSGYSNPVAAALKVNTSAGTTPLVGSLPATPVASASFRGTEATDSPSAPVALSRGTVAEGMVPVRTSPEIAEMERIEKLRVEAKNIMTSTLQRHLVFETIPISGKVVVFDSELQVRYAFTGLLQHGVNCAPVWNHSRRGYIGLLSVTDFLEILVHTYETHKSGRAEIGSLKISDWQMRLREQGASISKLLCVAPEVSLLEATEHLLTYRVHRLAVVTDALAHTVLCFLTQHKILEALLKVIDPTVPPTAPHAPNEAQRNALMLTVREARIGRFQGSLVTATLDTPVLDALRTLKRHRITALPLLDPETGVVVDAFSRSDVRLLVHHDDYEYLAERPLKLRDILAYVPVRPPVASCSMDDTLIDIARKLYVSERHQLLCLDENKRLMGIVSLTDLFAFIVGRTLDSNRVIAGDEMHKPPQGSQHSQQSAQLPNQPQQNHIPSAQGQPSYDTSEAKKANLQVESELKLDRASSAAEADFTTNERRNSRIAVGGGKIVGLCSRTPASDEVEATLSGEIRLDEGRVGLVPASQSTVLSTSPQPEPPDEEASEPPSTATSR